MRRLEQPLSVLIGPRERTFHITKKLGLQKSFRKGPAIYGDKRSLGAKAIFMNGAGHQLFSGSTLPGDEHAACLRSDGLNQIENRAHLGALSYDVVEPREPAQLAAQVTGLLFPPETFADLLDRAA